MPSVFPHIFDQGIHILEQELNLKVKEMDTARAAAEQLHQNPKQRAEDINRAFADPEIKAIFSSIGGDDSIRILPYLDTDLIMKNPKIIMGHRDNTTFLTYLNQLGMVTYYGPTVMAGISQLHRLEENYKRHIQDLLFHPSDTYEFQPYTQWSEGYPDWADPNNTGEINANKLNTEGWRWLQGEGINSGKLYGGCIEVLEMLKGTRFFCDVEFFNDKILFLENAEGTTTVEHIRRTIRSYGMQGMLERIQALLIGRARDYSDQEKQQLDDAIISVVRDEFQNHTLPVITNVDFGHTDPMFILPMGIRTEINCDEKRIRLVEPSVL
ncbi:LOW QUALITY PROTEIN: muramoyltetrapeptide carboxypeptidase [Geomicrobium sp. JCM 19038]|nr:LOW QUALITY PROTEIN: muramoyltetrapeptide carboxypeptidase [Geomicrobium sp. JCM 19038]